ncbi:MAG TPA: hypothetical protein VF707_19595, partial [Ardenticatenaceae bacterium]
MQDKVVLEPTGAVKVYHLLNQRGLRVLAALSVLMALLVPAALLYLRALHPTEPQSGAWCITGTFAVLMLGSAAFLLHAANHT